MGYELFTDSLHTPTRAKKHFAHGLAQLDWLAYILSDMISSYRYKNVNERKKQ